ncbi:MAG TPA: nucleotidyl transferase AbiEii/AbiGii toxin family protein [Verrucomicrobiae bacterium]|nr:nucleotidyl transferase AbiEii/AbiGii toxin family protein [Verrucomicrobiae bacterium]
MPRQRLDVLRRAAAESAFDFQPNDDEAAVMEFLHDGLDLHNYQQNFIVDEAVKVSFFAPDGPMRSIFSSRPGNFKVRVASLGEIFKAKSLVSAMRSKTRDWLDLYLLMRDHGFSIQDYKTAFDEAGVPAQCDIGLARLCSGVPQRDDEGFEHLLATPRHSTRYGSFSLNSETASKSGVQQLLKKKAKARKSNDHCRLHSPVFAIAPITTRVFRIFSLPFTRLLPYAQKK